ncbi:MAG: hypothetical protein KKC54_07810 [Nanoarchaeota archaeon]|nr:hypothetical protein [Nanoarchaeota archaeon]
MSKEVTAIMNNTEKPSELANSILPEASATAIPVIEGLENKRFKRNIPETTFSMNTEVFMLIY